MTQTHTPGPWFFHRDELLHDGRPNGSLHLVADVDQEGNGLDWQTNEANARLIAAAPDMLEALRRLEAMVRILPPDMDAPDSALAQARAAIAKATGEAQ
jgi:hypothetical protein